MWQLTILKKQWVWRKNDFVHSRGIGLSYFYISWGGTRAVVTMGTYTRKLFRPEHNCKETRKLVFVVFKVFVCHLRLNMPPRPRKGPPLASCKSNVTHTHQNHGKREVSNPKVVQMIMNEQLLGPGTLSHASDRVHVAIKGPPFQIAFRLFDSRRGVPTRYTVPPHCETWSKPSLAYMPARQLRLCSFSPG